MRVRSLWARGSVLILAMIASPACFNTDLSWRQLLPKLVFVSPYHAFQTLQVGSTLSISVNIVDGNGAVQNNLSGPVVTLSAYTDSSCTTPTSAPPDNQIAQVAVVSGTAAFAPMTPTPQPGTFYLAARADGFATGCSGAIQFVPGPAAQVRLLRAQQDLPLTAIAGQPFAATFVATDPYGNRVATTQGDPTLSPNDYTVAVEREPVGAGTSFSGPYELAASLDGASTINPGTKAGLRILKITPSPSVITGGVDWFEEIVVIPAAPDHFSWGAGPSGILTESNIGLLLEVLDTYGNLATFGGGGASVSVAPGGGESSVSFGSSISFSAGVWARSWITARGNTFSGPGTVLTASGGGLSPQPLAISTVESPYASGSSTMWTGLMDTNYVNSSNWTGGTPGSASRVDLPPSSPNSIQTSGILNLSGMRILGSLVPSGTLLFNISSISPLLSWWDQTGSLDPTSSLLSFSVAATSASRGQIHINQGAPFATARWNDLSLATSGAGFIAIDGSVFNVPAPATPAIRVNSLSFSGGSGKVYLNTRLAVTAATVNIPAGNALVIGPSGSLDLLTPNATLQIAGQVVVEGGGSILVVDAAQIQVAGGLTLSGDPSKRAMIQNTGAAIGATINVTGSFDAHFFGLSGFGFPGIPAVSLTGASSYSISHGDILNLPGGGVRAFNLGPGINTAAPMFSNLYFTTSGAPSDLRLFDVGSYSGPKIPVFGVYVPGLSGGQRAYMLTTEQGSCTLGVSCKLIWPDTVVKD